jgi:hypothetical protein
MIGHRPAVAAGDLRQSWGKFLFFTASQAVAASLPLKMNWMRSFIINPQHQPDN